MIKIIFAIHSFSNEFQPNRINFKYLAQHAVLENVSLIRYIIRSKANVTIY